MKIDLYKNYDWLYQKYVCEELSPKRIGKLVNRAPRTIYDWLIRLNIPTRKNGRDFMGRYIKGHKLSFKNHADVNWTKNPRWQGGKCLDSRGYVSMCIGNGKRKLEHVVIAEKALGRSLKKGECVHHINGIKADNRNCNLLICTNSYHRWLEMRMATLYKQEHFGGK